MVKLWLPQAVFGYKCKIEARSEEKENPRILSMRAYQNISIKKNLIAGEGNRLRSHWKLVSQEDKTPIGVPESVAYTLECRSSDSEFTETRC